MSNILSSYHLRQAFFIFLPSSLLLVVSLLFFLSASSSLSCRTLHESVFHSYQRTRHWKHTLNIRGQGEPPPQSYYLHNYSLDLYLPVNTVLLRDKTCSCYENCFKFWKAWSCCISETELESDSHLESWSQRLFAPCLDWVTPSSMENYRGNIVQSVLLSAPAWRMEIWPRMKKHITPRSGEVWARMKAQGCERVVFLPFARDS